MAFAENGWYLRFGCVDIIRFQQISEEYTFSYVSTDWLLEFYVRQWCTITKTIQINISFDTKDLAFLCVLPHIVFPSAVKSRWILSISGNKEELFIKFRR